ncbi:MAG: terminase small subunit [Fermentimonas sp.]|nr:terminase small subunit [Fermentimonas sp.]
MASEKFFGKCLDNWKNSYNFGVIMEDDNNILVNEGDLNERQERFCQEYVIDLNGTQSAIRAGYSQKTAYSIAYNLLKKVEIQQRIKEIQSDLQKATGLTAIRILNEHKKLAFSSIAHLHDTWIERKDFEKLTKAEKDSIKSISTKVLKAQNIGTKDEPEIVDIEYVKIELWDKQKSLDSIANLLGLNAPIKNEVDTGGLVVNFVSGKK